MVGKGETLTQTSFLPTDIVVTTKAIKPWQSEIPPLGQPHFIEGDPREIMQVTIDPETGEVILHFENLSTGELEPFSVELSDLPPGLRKIIPKNFRK